MESKLLSTVEGAQLSTPEQACASDGVAAPQLPSSTRMTAAELLSADFPAPNFIVPGLIPVGLTYITGRPKVGKSILSLQLAKAKGSGTPFLGTEITQGKVLYIDFENGRARLQRRCRDLSISSEASIGFQFGWPYLDQHGLKKLMEEISQNSWDIVIIDTFSRALSEADQMDNQQMTNLVGELQRFALRSNMSVILIDHQRKPGPLGPDPTDDLLGSTGKSAPADAIIALYKGKGGRQRELKGVSRDEEEISILLEWQEAENGWVLSQHTSTRAETRKDKVFAAVLELSAKNEAPTTTKIANRIGCDPTNVNPDLKQLVVEGKLVLGQKQGRDVPYYPASLVNLNTYDNNNNDAVECK